MKLVSRTEEMMLLAVYSLQPGAYGLAIGEYLGKLTRRRWSVGAIYVPLDRLEKQGLLSAYDGDPTPERGGRSKRFYKLTPRGLESLAEVKRLNDALWAQAPEFKGVQR
jgi:DNA-binding PadR family transcriptional regulator